ncbi:MAG: hypothetical protein V3U87_04150 [Methylococcaceae bacterium]
MCSRDEIVEYRHCYQCGEEYYGNLGHRGCSGRAKETEQQGRAKKEP